VLPVLDSEGFLPDADGEYVYQDDADGLWYYISHDLYVNIRRYVDPEEKNIWLETEVRTRGDVGLESLSGEADSGTQTPVAIARANQAVLAFTDDFYKMRAYGIVIRGGEIRRNHIRNSSTSYPGGDTLAVFADGAMQAFDYNEYTAEEYLAMGAHDVLSFGPWLVRNGEINPKLLNGTYMHYREPRCALGMIAPGHYLILTVDGRYDGANGTYIDWLAARMHEAGVTEAINLDGGGTTALVFMGTQVSRVASAKPDGTNTRKVNSLLGFGTSDAVPN
jgi:exopolysaccharide biosynthesis protein